METHGRLCCWDCRPCFRVQPCHARTQGFKPPLFSQSVTVQLDVAENWILLPAIFLSIFKRTASDSLPASPKPIEFASIVLSMLCRHNVKYPCSGTLLHILMLSNLAWLGQTLFVFQKDRYFPCCSFSSCHAHSMHPFRINMLARRSTEKAQCQET